MPDVKVVFVQVEDDDKKIGEFLGSIKQNKYMFVVLPASAKFISKEELERLLRKVS